MRRILACLLVLSMMLAFSACQNTKPAGTPDEPSVPAEPVEPVQPDEPAQPDTPEQPSEPDAPETPEEPSVRCLPLSYQTNRYYGMFDEGMKSYVDYPRIRVDGGDWPALADALDRLSAELYDEAMDLAEDLDELPLGSSEVRIPARSPRPSHARMKTASACCSRNSETTERTSRTGNTKPIISTPRPARS